MLGEGRKEPSIMSRPANDRPVGSGRIIKSVIIRLGPITTKAIFAIEKARSIFLEYRVTFC